MSGTQTLSNNADILKPSMSHRVAAHRPQAAIKAATQSPSTKSRKAEQRMLRGNPLFQMAKNKTALHVINVKEADSFCRSVPWIFSTEQHRRFLQCRFGLAQKYSAYNITNAHHSLALRSNGRTMLLARCVHD